MKRLLIHRRDIRIQLKGNRYTRSKDDWESIKSFPYNPSDEHEEPTEIPHDVYNKDYYHFGFKALSDDSHPDNKFFLYRQWQHLYLIPT
jgi:hypothetical protein